MTLAISTFNKRPLRWSQENANTVCFVDELWNRRIEVPATHVFGDSTVTLTADFAYSIDGYQDDLVISFQQYLLHVIETSEGYDVLSLTTSEEDLLAAYQNM